MFIKYLFYFTAILCFNFSSIYAQKSSSNHNSISKQDIYFEKDTINFGLVAFETFPIQVGYFFHSLFKKKISIKSVKVGCTCLITSYSKNTLSYGEKGFVYITFDPYKPGKVQEKIILTFQLENEIKTYQLYFEGKVSPSLYQDLANYDYQLGPLKVKNKKINLGIVHNTQVVKEQINFFNDSDNDLQLYSLVSAPDHIKVYFSSSPIIKARDITSVDIYYNAQVRNNFGLVSENITFFIKDSIPIPIPINIEATILKKTETHFKELLPDLLVYKPNKDLGYKKIKLPTKVSFKLKNRGKNELIIYKVIAKVGCKVENFNTVSLKSGESVDLKVIIHSVGKTGRQKRSLTVYSNDHDKPKHELSVLFKE